MNIEIPAGTLPADTIGDILLDTFEGEVWILGAWLKVCENEVRWRCHDQLDVLAEGRPRRLVAHKRKVILTSPADAS